MIETEKFLSAMEDRWTRDLHNVSSAALRQAWAQLADTFNAHIAAHARPESATTWTVLQPPTGAGKSQGTAVYCSLLPTDGHPGVLIVTRLKADADRMAETINALARRVVAVAYHSDSKKDVPLQSLCFVPVVVITHRAYELALDHLGQDGSIQQTWPFFHDWDVGTRKLVVIDEALDILEESQATLEGLRQTLAAIPQTLRGRFPVQLQALRETIDCLEVIQSKQVGKRPAELLRRMVEEGTPPEFNSLRAELKGVRFDQQIGRQDEQERSRLRALHDLRLRDLHNLLCSWMYYAKVPAAGHTLNTARLLVPENAKGAVVLDATASSSVLYKLFERASVVASPPGVRSYANVRLHVSRGHKVGKLAMKERPKQAAEELVAELNERLAGRSVFICTHQHQEPFLASLETTFAMHTGHWGAVDGSNAWRDCDAAVIFGLPYRPDTWSANAFFALQGVQDTSWLQSKEYRAWGEYKDIRTALRTGQTVTEVVQAINRVRCRKVIDAQGNCPTVDVYLLLPGNHVATDIIAAIKRDMPGIKVGPWSYGGAKAKPKRTNHEAAVALELRTMPCGKVSASVMRAKLGIPQRSWERIVTTMREPGSCLSETLAATGVRYEVTRRGKTQQSLLVKD